MAKKKRGVLSLWEGRQNAKLSVWPEGSMVGNNPMNTLLNQGKTSEDISDSYFGTGMEHRGGETLDSWETNPDGVGSGLQGVDWEEADTRPLSTKTSSPLGPGSLKAQIKSMGPKRGVNPLAVSNTSTGLPSLTPGAPAIKRPVGRPRKDPIPDASERLGHVGSKGQTGFSLGSASQYGDTRKLPVTIDEAKEVVSLAFTKSGMTEMEWNDLDDDDKSGIIADLIERDPPIDATQKKILATLFSPSAVRGVGWLSKKVGNMLNKSGGSLQRTALAKKFDKLRQQGVQAALAPSMTLSIMQMPNKGMILNLGAHGTQDIIDLDADFEKDEVLPRTRTISSPTRVIANQETRVGNATTPSGNPQI